MYDKIAELQIKIQEARRAALQSLLATTGDEGANDLARHLTCLEFQMRAAEFTAAEAVNAALTLKTIRAHYEHANHGGESGR